MLRRDEIIAARRWNRCVGGRDVTDCFGSFRVLEGVRDCRIDGPSLPPEPVEDKSGLSVTIELYLHPKTGEPLLRTVDDKYGGKNYGRC